MSTAVQNPNIPVIDLNAALAPSALLAWLDHEYAAHTARANELMGAHGRFLEATKDGIVDDVIAGRATDFAKQLKAEVKNTDETRTKIKAPVLHAQRLIDGEAKKLTDKLGLATSQVETRIAAYLKDKADKEKAVRQAEADRLAAEAEAAVEAAVLSGATEDHETAVEALGEAQAAEEKAAAPTVDLTRTRSALGSLAGLKDNWIYAVVDLSKVPAHLLTINDAAVKLAIKQGTRDVPGLRIYNDPKVMVR